MARRPGVLPPAAERVSSRARPIRRLQGTSVVGTAMLAAWIDAGCEGRSVFLIARVLGRRPGTDRGRDLLRPDQVDVGEGGADPFGPAPELGSPAIDVPRHLLVGGGQVLGVQRLVVQHA